jgi:hypothetical protein
MFIASNSTQSASGAVERLEPHHWFHNALDASMILFNPIIQIFALSQLGLLVDCPIFFEGLHGDGISRIFIHGNDLWSSSVLTFQDFTKEACCCLAIPLCP